MSSEVVTTSGEAPPRRALISAGATQRVLAFAALIVLFTVFSLASPNFLRFNNIATLLTATAINGILAVGVTYAIIAGGIDLSIGTVMTISAVMTGHFITTWGFPVAVGILGGIATGALAGVINGIVIAKLKIPPFIATLGMMNVAKGLALIITESKPIYFNGAPEFREIVMGSVVGTFFPEFEVPNIVLIMFLAAIVAALVLSRTVLGRYTFALGSNEEATRLSGVRVDRWKIAVYTVCGIFSGLAGVVLAARVNSAQPATGQGYELDAIAAVVIGGTSLSGGEGTILGTVIGAFVLSVLLNGLRILSVPQEWQIVVTGAIVILAVFLDIQRRRRQ